MASYTSKQYAIALYQAIFESNPINQEMILDNFIAVLKENGDLGKIDEIEREFFDYDRQVRNIKVAEVVSAKKLSKTEEAEIIQKLNTHVGSKVELKARIDAGLVGGIVIRLGDELIDGSVKTSLAELKDQLMK